MTVLQWTLVLEACWIIFWVVVCFIYPTWGWLSRLSRVWQVAFLLATMPLIALGVVAGHQDSVWLYAAWAVYLVVVGVFFQRIAFGGK